MVEYDCPLGFGLAGEVVLLEEDLGDGRDYELLDDDEVVAGFLGEEQPVKRAAPIITTATKNHNRPEGSARITGLLPQYANIFWSSKP